jgi:hypothetical protein
MNGVRVVVGEAAPAGAGTLRSILQAEGFEVVGQASSAEQLQPVLAAADPQVIVFDAYTTATTVLSARDWAPRAGIVVVWPSSVLAPGADQQVEPARAQTELGDAVRRAVRIRRTPPAVPTEVPDVLVFEEIPEAEEPAAVSSRLMGGASVVGLRPRRFELALTLAAASIAFLVVAAIAFQSGGRPGFLAQRTSPTPSTPPATVSPGTVGGGVRGGSVVGHTVSLPPDVVVSTATISGLGPVATTPVAGNEATPPTTSPGSLSRIPGVMGFVPGEFPGGVGLAGRLSGASGRSGETHAHGNKHGHGGPGDGNRGGGHHGAKHDDGHRGQEGDDRKHSGHGGNGHRKGHGRPGGHGRHRP